MRDKPEKPLTEVELEMMNVIWDIGPASVNQILQKLPPDRKLAYTSVSTMVRILEQKKYVMSTKEGRGHLYSALVSREDYQAKSLGYLVKNVFADTPSALVRQLLESKALTTKDIREIQNLLEKGTK